MKKTRLLILFGSAVFLAWLGVRWAASQSRPAHRLGVSDGRLAPCPDHPNCVCTQAARADQRIEPIALREPAGEALRRLEAVVRSMPRSRVVTAEEGYLHAEFRTLLLGFVDDLEVLVDEEDGVMHVRSASRVGRSDFGVNRRRVEELRRRLQDNGQEAPSH